MMRYNLFVGQILYPIKCGNVHNFLFIIFLGRSFNTERTPVFAKNCVGYGCKNVNEKR